MSEKFPHDELSATPISTVIVPCYNEASRLDVDRFGALASPSVRLLFVNDGSTDNTRQMLDSMAERFPDVAALHLDANQGKGEAVRLGLLEAMSASPAPEVVAYFDADLAAPVEELLRALNLLGENRSIDGILGARIALLGNQIERSRARHVQGRIFATLASTSLRFRIYDTQCGLKAFRVTPTLRSALTTPFSSRWIFDVELIARLLRPAANLEPARLVEMPLEKWHDASGSHLTTSARSRAFTDLVRIVRAERKRPQVTR